MPFDGVATACMVHELNKILKGGKIDKVQQPDPDEIRLVIRNNGSNHTLVLSANSSTPRVHLTDEQKENPLTAPAFCMFLRKHLAGAKVVGFSQPQLERVICLTAENYDELGDLTQKHLYAEIMGRHSNLILVSAEGKVLDAIKRVDFSISSVRQILPGLEYELPPKQDKVDPTECDAEDFLNVFRTEEGDTPVHKVLLNRFLGVSPLLARELTYDTFGQTATRLCEASEGWKKRLAESCAAYFKAVKDGRFSPCVLLDPKSGKPMDYAPTLIRQYGNNAGVQSADSLSQAMGEFFRLRDRAERMRQRSATILHVLTTHLERCRKKEKLHEETALELENREQLKICGDLLIANLYRIPAGAEQIVLPNYYAEDGGEMTILLDPQKTPSQNAQHYYKRYNKAKNAELALAEQKQKNQEETAYLESVFDALSRASTPAEIAEIRDELQDQGYLKTQGGKKRKAAKSSEPMRFISSDGFVILTGRNNRQNDYVTLKLSRAEDVWFHTKNIPGSHTLIKSNGQEVPQQTLFEAAMIAAFFSKAGNSSNVPVDFTAVKNVKKPVGAKPGMVIYDHYHTLYVTPDEAFTEKLKEH